MTRRTLLPPLALLTLLCATAARAGDFTVQDGMARQEIAENSRLYVDGTLVATFRLSSDMPDKTQRVHVDDMRMTHDYALCGEITIRLPDGRTEIHEVNSEGTLHHPDGHHLVALGTANFTEFFLADLNDQSIGEHHPGRSSVCSPPST